MGVQRRTAAGAAVAKRDLPAKVLGYQGVVHQLSLASDAGLAVFREDGRFTNVRDEGGYKKDLLPKAQEPIKQAGGKY